MQPQPYAPYPLNGVRDWFYRWRNWVRVGVVMGLGAGLGPAGYRLWNMPGPVVGTGSTPSWNYDAGLNIPPPEVDASKALLAAINSLPTEPSAGPTATPAPAGMRWVTWDEYERTQGMARDNNTSGGQPPGATFNFDMGEALRGPWMENRFHLGQVVSYLELPATESALQAVSQLSRRPYCVGSGAVSPGGMGGFAEVRGIVKLMVARAHCRLAGKHDYPGAAEDLETIWELSAGMEDDGMLIPFYVGIACRALADSEVTSWCGQGLLTPAQAKDLLVRLDRNRIDGQAVCRRTREGERRSALSFLDGLYGPGEHARQVIHASAPVTGNWVVRSVNLLSPVTYDRSEAQRWIQAVWDLERQEDGGPGQSSKCEPLRKRISEDPLFAMASFSEYWGTQGLANIMKRTEAEEAAARTALALTLFKADRGRYPARLEELVPDYLPALGADPYADGPLRYRVGADGRFVLYSVGLDRQDDGGTVQASYGSRGDSIYTPVGGPTQEWVLVPAESVSRPASAPSESNSDGGFLRRPVRLAPR